MTRKRIVSAFDRADVVEGANMQTILASVTKKAATYPKISNTTIGRQPATVAQQSATIDCCAPPKPQQSDCCATPSATVAQQSKTRKAQQPATVAQHP